jgi:hypothetical protein
MAVGVVFAGVRLPDRLGRPGPLERSLVTPRRRTAGPAYPAQALPSKSRAVHADLASNEANQWSGLEEAKNVSVRSSVIVVGAGGKLTPLCRLKTHPPLSAG